MIDVKKETAKQQMGWFALQYAHNMCSGRAKLESLENEWYPEVKPLSIEAFARTNKNAEVQGMSKSLS